MIVKRTTLINLVMPAVAFLFFAGLCGECMADIRHDSIQVLARHILEYNTELSKARTTDQTVYQGEEGLLQLKPDVAEKLGLRVYIDQDYHDSVRLKKEADEALLSAEKIMAGSDIKEPEHAIITKILLTVLVYREKSGMAKERLSRYKKNINKENDERFNSERSKGLIVILLEKSLQDTDNNLRNALGLFYNKCRGDDQSREYITSENVRFINHVFNRFIAEASPSEISLFDIDRNDRNGSDSGAWKSIVQEDLPELLPYLESAVKKTGESIYRTDPLLFLALMKRESAFDPEAVSSVGAAGLTQIMPHTARDMGLKNIYTPQYYYTAGDYLKKERNLKIRAKKMLLKITKKEDIEFAKKARELMLRSIESGKKRADLYEKYKNELVNITKDDRLDPSLAIASGYLYFSRLMRSQKGDISLALASYNAGGRRVRDYKGIPPFDETVTFRNRVLQYYYEYLQRIRK